MRKHLGGQLWGEKMVKRAIVKNSNFTALCRITPLCTDNKISKKIQRATVDFLMSSSLPGAIKCAIYPSIESIKLNTHM